MSGCYFSVIFSNKLLNFVLFYKCGFSVIVLKFSVKLYIKILEKLWCRENVSYTTHVTVKCPNFKILNLI